EQGEDEDGDGDAGQPVALDRDLLELLAEVEHHDDEAAEEHDEGGHEEEPRDAPARGDVSDAPHDHGRGGQADGSPDRAPRLAALLGFDVARGRVGSAPPHMNSSVRNWEHRHSTCTRRVKAPWRLESEGSTTESDGSA